MRTFLDGSGSDSTAAVQAYLAAHRELHLADLYIVKTAPNYDGYYMGRTFLLTDYSSPLLWSYKGTFVTGNISRNEVESKIGLEADKLEVIWSPQDSDILADDGGTPATTLLTVLQGFGCGIFDNGTLEVWRCLMPTIGDCDTLGACLMFSGRIGDIEPDRLKAKLTVNSRLELLNQQVPTNLIEPTNILAQYMTGQMPAGAPIGFTVVAGTVLTKVYADGTPTMPDGTYDGGYIVFTAEKLGGTYRRVRAQTVESGHHAFYLYEPLPFLPQVGDNLEAYIPIAADSGKTGFPYVPSPVSSAVVIA